MAAVVALAVAGVEISEGEIPVIVASSIASGMGSGRTDLDRERRGEYSLLTDRTPVVDFSFPFFFDHSVITNSAEFPLPKNAFKSESALTSAPAISACVGPTSGRNDADRIRGGICLVFDSIGSTMNGFFSFVVDRARVEVEARGAADLDLVNKELSIVGAGSCGRAWNSSQILCTNAMSRCPAGKTGERSNTQLVLSIALSVRPVCSAAVVLELRRRVEIETTGCAMSSCVQTLHGRMEQSPNFVAFERELENDI